VEPVFKKFWGYRVKIDMSGDGLVSWANYWLVICVVSYGSLWGMMVGSVICLFIHSFGFRIYLVVPGSDLRGSEFPGSEGIVQLVW